MTIRKGVITYTFMFDDTINPVDEVNELELADIIYQCERLHMLGQASRGDYNIVEVPNDEVAAEEIKLGCDGTFFADPDELAHQEMDANSDE
jgi:hypothetical protein